MPHSDPPFASRITYCGVAFWTLCLDFAYNGATGCEDRVSEFRSA
jgi:hypothetical protein